MQMEEDQKICEYLSKLIASVNQMQTCDEVFPNQQVVEKMMRSLTSRFYFIMVDIHEPKYLNNVKIEEFHTSLEDHEHMVIDRGTAKLLH